MNMKELIPIPESEIYIQPHLEDGSTVLHYIFRMRGITKVLKIYINFELVLQLNRPGFVLHISYHKCKIIP